MLPYLFSEDEGTHYKSHKGYVVKLFFQHYVFTDELLDDIQTQFGSIFKSKEEIKHVLRLMNYSQEEWEHHPLAKLTHDITEQINKLDTSSTKFSYLINVIDRESRVCESPILSVRSIR